MSRAAQMLASCLPQQRALICSPSLTKVAWGTRRAGKTWGLGVYFMLTALAFPESSSLYLGLTKGTAAAIMNKDVLGAISKRFAVGARWLQTDHAWHLPNGSIIYIRGADANSYEIQKVVGQKYRLAVLDECSKYRYVVKDMVYQALLPAMGDDLGTIVLAGTPSNVVNSLFHDVTTGRETGWDVHRLEWRQNTAKLSNIKLLHAKLLHDRPGYEATPQYKQEWLGEWVVDTSALVYRWREDLNTAAELPRPKSEYTYVLGVDLGYTDPSALVVGAYHENDPTLYVVYAEKRKGQTISDVAEWIGGLWYMPSLGHRGPFPFAAMVADASARQGVEEMRVRHHLPLEAAEKPGKRDVIEIMNSDLGTGRVKVLPAGMAITEEWGALIWDEKKRAAMPPRWEEDGRLPNHLCDAGLYMWRKARNYDALPEMPKAPAYGTMEWEEARFQREMAKRARMEAEGGLMIDELPPWLQEVG